LESIKKCPNLWKVAFVRGSSKAKSPDEFLDDLKVKHSQSQLRKEKEIDVFKYFCEFIQLLESDECMKVHKTLKLHTKSRVSHLLSDRLYSSIMFILII
jgi:hypothetical protein